MLQVREILQSPTFQNFQLLAGEAGLEHEVRSVSILDYEAVFDDFSDFGADTLVLTSLLFAREAPEKILTALASLTERHIAGFAVKTVIFQALPQEVLDFAEAQGVPLFLFHDTYMEDLVVNVNDLLKIKQNYLLLEEKIAFLLQTDKPESLIESTAREINTAFESRVLAAYLLPQNQKSALHEVRDFFARLFYKKYRQLAHGPQAYLKYESGILLLATFPKQDVPADAAAFFHRMMQKLDIQPQHFTMGISTVHPTFRALDAAIQESLQANRIARFTDTACMLYADLGIHRYLQLLYEDKRMALPYRQAMEILSSYDEKYTSNLFETLQLYIEAHGEISAVAGKLFQHPNTIRYRLRKARELLEPVFGREDFYEQLFITMRLQSYRQMEACKGKRLHIVKK